MTTRHLFTAALAILGTTTSASATVAMDYVRVGNPNNAADPTTSYGAVDHTYWIGKYEVTNAQYAEFLNAKGQSNANGIYNSTMPTYGITQSGISGSFSYTVTTALANHPVVLVSWFDAARFANWMSNGQGNGDMETGAYTLNGATSEIITANAGAKVYIPSENEWYKASYYNAGNTSYSLYPNGQNTITTEDANYDLLVSTDVGIYSDDPSSYGTFDQGGNVWEVTDEEILWRMHRGGAWGNTDTSLLSSGTYGFGKSREEANIGFRVAAASIDTDSDGIDDLAETNTGIYISATNTGTNPNSADTDGDGVPDGLELKEKTSPVDATKFNAFSKGMVAYYPFNGNAKDTTGNGNTGIETNVTYASDRSAFASSAGDFRQNAYVEVPNLHSLKNYPITCSAWIYLETHQTNLSWNGWGDMFILGKDEPGIVGSVIGLHTNAQFTNALSYTDFQSNYVPSLKKWMQVALTINSDRQAALYVDGSQTASWQASTAEFTDLPFLISTPYIFNQFARQSFQGYLDDIRIYDRALAPTEVAALYSSERPRFQIIQGSYTWQQAKADAEARGGRLAVLNTQAKIDEMNGFLVSQGSWPFMWIGLTDESTEGRWRWIDGVDLTAANWQPTQPSGLDSAGSDEDYVHILPSPGEHEGMWNDLPNTGGYNSPIGYLLEFPDPKSVLTLNTPTHGTITGSGEYDPGTSATLTAVPNPGYRFTGWTGDASGTENPLTITMDANKTVGATFEKDLSDADSDGLTAYDELVVHSTNPALADTDGDGLIDGYELGIGRFSIVTGSFTWQQARTDARSKGGDLASFPTEDRWNRALQNLGADPFEEFTGLWIGASDAAVDGTWTWLNGESFSFAPWGTGRPSSTSGNSLDFAEVSGGGGAEIGKWYDRSPTTIRDGYLMETGYATSPTAADADGDGLNDGQEQTAGTRPTLADTDSDGLSDGQEVNLTQTSPRLADTDGDGNNDAASDQDGDSLTNLAEISTHRTDPRKADTDGDGLSDGVELSHPGRFFTMVEGSFTQTQAAADAASRRGRLASFPNANDFTRAAGRARKTTQGYLWLGLSDAATEGTWLWSDGNAPAYARWLDGQPDGGTGENHAVLMENSNQWADAAAEFIAAGYLFERVGLDPLATDTDGDGLSDGAEVNTNQTNPVLDDSDSDGLTDGAELNTHGSNPKLADTDGDGLSDFAEVVTHGTNPAAKDSDADGFDDLFEINTGFNPTQASSTPDALSSIRTAVEFRFNAGNGLRYRIESSTDLQTWSTEETDIVGAGGVVTRFYSIENQPKRYFRVVKIAGSADPDGDGI